MRTLRRHVVCAKLYKRRKKIPWAFCTLDSWEEAKLRETRPQSPNAQKNGVHCKFTVYEGKFKMCNKCTGYIQYLRCVCNISIENYISHQTFIEKTYLFSRRKFGISDLFKYWFIHNLFAGKTFDALSGDNFLENAIFSPSFLSLVLKIGIIQ